MVKLGLGFLSSDEARENAEGSIQTHGSRDDKCAHRLCILTLSGGLFTGDLRDGSRVTAERFIVSRVSLACSIKHFK